MPPALVVPVSEAALFTLGCVAIHGLRRHADTVTATLACFATILILILGLAYAPEPLTRYRGVTGEEFSMAELPVY